MLDEPRPTSPSTSTSRSPPQAGGIRLLDSSAAPIALGPTEQGSDPTVVVTAVPEIPDGAYVVAWQVVSQDGHPLSGAFAFQVGRDAAVDTRDLLASVLSGQQGDGTVEQLATFARLLTYAGLALGHRWRGVRHRDLAVGFEPLVGPPPGVVRLGPPCSSGRWARS